MGGGVFGVSVLLILLPFMLLYSSTLFYVFCLVSVVLSLLFTMSVLGTVGGLTVLVLLVVYLGAVMILIGYICAVAPNVNEETPLLSNVFVGLAFCFSLSLFCSSKMWVCGAPSPLTVAPFYYTSWGMASLALILLMLFVTLLIVTSQYLVPNGPFRSVT